MLVLLLSLLLLWAPAAGAQSATVPAPSLNAPDWGTIEGVSPGPRLTAGSAILIEADNATVLYAKNADLATAPASLTKMAAIHVALVAAALGEIDLDEPLAPSPPGWASAQPPDSSLLFLGRDQLATTRELLAGLAVASGNDAAVELALRLAPSVADFVDRMNDTVAMQGIGGLFFFEPAGLSPSNRATAAALGRFALAHIATFPFATREIYSLREFTYPAETNRLTDSAIGPITQFNRNRLLWSYPGADGLKSGFIDESGYHLAATAVREGRRLIAIVMGIRAPSHDEGSRIRAEEAAALLDHGFHDFSRMEFNVPETDPIRVYHGERTTIKPVRPESIVVSVPNGAESRLSGTVETVGSVTAPLPADRVLGTVTVTLDGVTLARAELASEEIARAGVVRSVIDSVARFFARMSGGAEATPGIDLPEAKPAWLPLQ